MALEGLRLTEDIFVSSSHAFSGISDALLLTNLQ